VRIVTVVVAEGEAATMMTEAAEAAEPTLATVTEEDTLVVVATTTEAVAATTTEAVEDTTTGIGTSTYRFFFPSPF
jgi:hypothetical protein